MLELLRAHDDLLLRSNQDAHFTASSWIINPARDRVLMVYHNIYQSWSWTGGHADGEGDLFQVALREAREETSLQSIFAPGKAPISLEILPVAAHIRRGQHVPAHLHLNLTYLLIADDHQRVTAKIDENSAVRWFPLDDAVNASSEPEMRPIYQKLNDRIRTIPSQAQ